MALDIRTIIALLALGDIAAIAIILVYPRGARSDQPIVAFLAGKAFQALAWTLLFFRSVLPDALSIHVGNGFLFLGFAAEALALGTIGGRDRRQELWYALIVVFGYIAFLIFLEQPNLRVVAASFVTGAIYARLSTVLLSRARRSPIRLTMGLAAGLYTLFMIARALIALKDCSFGLFTASLVQYLAFLPQYIVLIIGTVGFMLLVMERDDERLRESEEKYRSVAERANEAIVIIQDGAIVFANRRAAEMVRSPSSSALLGDRMDRWVFGGDLEGVKDRQKARLAGKAVEPGEEFRLVAADGAISWVSSSASVISFRGRPATLALLADIDERKRQQERIERLLAEKELLLREVNHRVKNNLGVAISLLSLQAGAAGNSGAEAVLTEAQARLTTMAELYESLHRAGSSGVLSIRDYLPSLTKEVAQLFPRVPAVRFALDLDEIQLGAELLSPIGIILNEIMTNSLKHAFETTGAPLISLSAKMRGGRVLIRCGDNGRGLPADFDPASSTGFGASLILALLRQIGASWRIDREGGTAWELEFPPSLSPR